MSQYWNGYLNRTIPQAHNGLYDITRQVEFIVADSGVQSGLVNVYVQGATAGIMILFILIYPVEEEEMYTHDIYNMY